MRKAENRRDGDDVVKENSRMKREARTIAAMVALYCRAHHGTRDGLCPECTELVTYARARLDRCPWQDDKPTCANCPVHCYKPAMRERMRAVMRYAGPRMLLRHPLLAILHMLDGRRPAPDLAALRRKRRAT